MSSRKCITPVGTLSYPHLFTPQDPMEEGGQAKYAAVIVFEEGTDLSDLYAIAETAAHEKFGAKAAALLEGGRLRMPFRTDGEEKGYAPGSTFLNAKTSNPPGVVSRWADPETGKPRKIDSPDEIYPGAQVRFSITAFGYDVKGNKGISFALNNVQKWDEGQRLDGRVRAEDEFTAEMPAAADLGDMDAPAAGGLSDFM